MHKTGCGACRVLLPSLAASDDMKKLGDKFVMVNAYDGLDPKAKQYAPDGAYVPRFAIFYMNIEPDLTVSVVHEMTMLLQLRV